MTLIILILITVSGLFAILHTPYATSLTQQAVNYFFNEQIHFESMSYQYPLNFRFNRIKIKPTEQQSISINHIELWLEPLFISNKKLAINSVLIDGATLPLPYQRPALFNSDHVHIQRLAFEKLNLIHQNWDAHNVTLQIDNPIWKETSSLLPLGNFLLSTKEFIWQGETIENLLLDMVKNEESSTVFGLSFTWREATISGQAEQYPDGWSLINMVIDKLHLSEEKIQDLTSLPWQGITSIISHINSLDLTHGSFSMSNMEVNNINLSLENIDLQTSIWQQQEGSISLSAESIFLFNQKWIEPTAKLELNTNLIEIIELQTELREGDIFLSGSLTPSSIDLTQLSIDGIKWFHESDSDFIQFNDSFDNINQLTIERLKINNSQLIQLSKKPFWQLTDVNLVGTSLSLLEQNQLRLWRGDINLTVSNMSYGDTISHQAIMNMRNDQGIWYVDRLMMPLEHGYIDASGHWDLNDINASWQAKLHADGMPLSTLNEMIELPIEINGLADFDMKANGFANDYTMFLHSLSAEANINIRDGLFNYEKTNHAFSIEKLAINVNQGKVSIPRTSLKARLSHSIDAQLEGFINLINDEYSELILYWKQNCKMTLFKFIRSQQTEQNFCQQTD